MNAIYRKVVQREPMITQDIPLEIYLKAESLGEKQPVTCEPYELINANDGIVYLLGIPAERETLKVIINEL